MILIIIMIFGVSSCCGLCNKKSPSSKSISHVLGFIDCVPKLEYNRCLYYHKKSVKECHKLYGTSEKIKYCKENKVK